MATDSTSAGPWEFASRKAGTAPKGWMALYSGDF